MVLCLGQNEMEPWCESTAWQLEDPTDLWERMALVPWGR